MTCGGKAGSLDMETIDAQFWADNGFDYLKYDVSIQLRSDLKAPHQVSHD